MHDTAEQLSDNEIIERIQAGDVNAYEMLIERYRSHVFAIAANHVPYKEIDEMAHEIFIRAYKSLGKYKGTSPLSHWLARIAVRTCYDFWRKRKRIREIPTTSLSACAQQWVVHVANANSMDVYMRDEEQQEAREVIEWALSQMPPAQRMLLNLLY